MTAKYTVMYQVDMSEVESDEAVMALVADEKHFEYIGVDPVDAEHFKKRAKEMTELHKNEAHSPDEWLRIGAENFNYIRFSDPVTVSTFQQAVSEAQLYFDEYDKDDSPNTEAEPEAEIEPVTEPETPEAEPAE